MAKLPRPAQYLLRIDDLCPTVNRQRWDRLREFIREFNIKPILSVVPDNQDRELEASSPNPEFWDEIRAMEAEGAVVALHGHQHTCNSRARSLIPIHRRSEFAGYSADVQRTWIRTGIEILEEHGLRPRLWVAPRHSFDMNTLRAIEKEGIRYLSDGLARVPFKRGGVTWIPQQLWEPVYRTAGLWTICIHPNSEPTAKLNALHQFLLKHADQFTSFDRVIREFEAEELGVVDKIRSRMAIWRMVLKRRLGRKKKKQHRRLA